VERGRKDFGRSWEILYFPTLWRGADEGHDSVRLGWQRQLASTAHDLIDDAAMRLPIHSNRNWRAITQAQSALRRVLHKRGLPMPGRAPAGLEDLKETAA